MIVTFEDDTTKEIKSLNEVEYIACTGIYPVVDGKKFKRIDFSYEEFCRLSLEVRFTQPFRFFTLG